LTPVVHDLLLSSWRCRKGGGADGPRCPLVDGSPLLAHRPCRGRLDLRRL